MCAIAYKFINGKNHILLMTTIISRISKQGDRKVISIPKIYSEHFEKGELVEVTKLNGEEIKNETGFGN